MPRDALPPAAAAPGRARRGRLVADAFVSLLDAPEVGRREVEESVRRSAPLLPVAEVRAVADAVLARFDGYGRLSGLLDDPEVAEVMVNAGTVWVERRGRLERSGVQLEPDELQQLIERLVGPAGARVDRASPIADVRLPDGSRANIVLPPLALDGPSITIRRFVLRRANVHDFCRSEVAEVLVEAVRTRTNLVVSGGTGSGKTTLLNALAGHLGADERIVTIEDTAELSLEHAHVVRLEARRPNSEGTGEVTIRQLVRAALRMRPDRILVGETRGGEVMDMLQAMNSGHEGSMSTCHANTPRHALRRLEALAMLSGADLPERFIRDQVCSAIGLVVHVRRGVDGRRAVSDVVALGPRADWRTGVDLVPVVRDGALAP